MAADDKNPQAERDQWGADTDREMLLLKFVKVDGGGQERPVGALNWYPIHPTDRGQKNTLVCGDNKGYASLLFEQQMGSDHRLPETLLAVQEARSINPQGDRRDEAGQLRFRVFPMDLLGLGDGGYRLGIVLQIAARDLAPVRATRPPGS